MKLKIIESSSDEAKKYAEVLQNKTCQKILDSIQEPSSPSQIAKKLQIPINTVTYNLAKLEKLGFVSDTHYSYSGKGKQVKHFQATQQNVIITPQRASIQELLTQIVPVFAVGLIGWWITMFANQPSTPMYAADSTMEAAPLALRAAEPVAPVAQSVGLEWYILLGTGLAIATLVLIWLIRYFKRN